MNADAADFRGSDVPELESAQLPIATTSERLKNPRLSA